MTPAQVRMQAKDVLPKRGFLMAKKREPADVRRYREAQEAKKRNRERDNAALQQVRDALTKVEKEIEDENRLKKKQP